MRHLKWVVAGVALAAITALTFGGPMAMASGFLGWHHTPPPGGGRGGTCTTGAGSSPGGTGSPAPTGSAAPAPSGAAAPAPSSSAAPAPSGWTAPAPSGWTAPAPTGSAAPAPSGWAAPSPSGSAAPVPTGSAAPAPTGSAAPAPTGAAAPAPPMASAPSLADWNLSLPVNSFGERVGRSELLAPATADAPWLTTGACGALEFFTPARGATTRGSTHPRTELRSTGHFTLGNGSANLAETLAVTQAPESGAKITVAEFLAPRGGYAHIQYAAGTVSVHIHGIGTITLLSGVPLGATFSDSMTVSGSALTVTATYAGQTVTKSFTNPPGFMGKRMIMAAGDYQRGFPGPGRGGGSRVTISALSALFASGRG